MLQTGYAAIRKRKRDLLGYVKGSAQRWGERQLWSSLRCGHRAVKEGACAARPSGSQCRRGSQGLGFPTCKQAPWGLVWTRRHTKGSAPLLACSPIRPGRPGPSDPGGPPCWDPQAQESPDGGDGSSSPVFPSPRQVTGSGNTNQQQQETDVREAPFLFPVSSPAPATPGPLTRGPTTAHDSPWGPALLPSLCSTGPPSQMPQGQAGPPPRPPGRQLPEGSPGSHSALPRIWKALEGPGGLGPGSTDLCSPLWGNCRAHAALHWRRWRQAGTRTVAVFPAPPTRGPICTSSSVPSFTRSSTHSATEHLPRGLAPGPPL